MPNRACPTEDQLLSLALTPGAEGAASEEMQEHLADCSECRIVVSELARASQVRPRTEAQAPKSGSVARGGEEPRFVPGDLIDGKYRVNDVLGRGGMGLVLGATHDVLGSRVAIKVPLLATRDDPEVRVRLLREARVVARLEGEYLGRVLDAGVLPGGYPFVVFEYLTGRSLAERLKQDGRLSLADAADAILESCAGLSVAHAAGIVHRDVKPSNLFEARRADGTTRTCVIDFGIAKTYSDVDTVTRSRVILGTPVYMAPEQVLAARVVDRRADVWALGMTLLELVTARSPSAGPFAEGARDEVAALARELVEGGARRKDAVVVARAIEKCVRDRPDERWSSVGELAEALAPVAGARGVAALGALGRVLAPKRRSKWGGVIAAAVAVIAAIGIASIVGSVAVRKPVAVADPIPQPIDPAPAVTQAPGPPSSEPASSAALPPPRTSGVAHSPVVSPAPRRAKVPSAPAPSAPPIANAVAAPLPPAPSPPVVRGSNGLDDRK